MQRDRAAGSRSIKVIEVGINRKPVCDFLLVINSMTDIISSRTRAKSVGVSKNVDGVSDCSSISKLFYDTYQKIYSCVSYNEHDMQHIKDEISSQIVSENQLDVCRFTTCDVKAAVHR